MQPRLDSLYLRLALVLLTALVAGFATMYWVFHSHLESNRMPGRGYATQMLLSEALLKADPQADIGAVSGLSLARGDLPPDSAPVRGDFRDLGPMTRLAGELGRPLDLRENLHGPGFWVKLALPEPRWLLLAPPRRQPGMEPWTWGLLVAFGVILLGGMALLWRVQVPLRQLERALGEIRPGAIGEPLQLTGPREVINLADQFNQMMARLRRHEEDRNVMLAGVAHDLRAPITRLRLQLETTSPAEARPAMAHNLDSVEAIVNQFLLFARGNDAEALAEYDVLAFVAEVLAPYEDQGVSVIDDPEQTLVAAIRADSLRRALCNLVDNALEYGAPPVSVRVARRDKTIVIAVADAGQGIPPAQRERALRPFTRLDQARSTQGHCGLGLSIAARVAESHGGCLRLGATTEGGLLAELVLAAA